MLDTLLHRATLGEKIAMLTCYDASFAKVMALAGVDILLVGDSLGMVMQGAANTLHVTMTDMVYHTRMVAAGAPNTVVMADMPIGSYEHDDVEALANAQALRQAGAHIVKLEGGGAIVHTAQYLVAHGIPVCAHLGFTPQSVVQLGGYKIQGNTDAGAQQLMVDALAMVDAGVSMVLFEMVPSHVAQHITQVLPVPTIGIGAGPACGGQVLVLQDVLGIYSGPAAQAPETYKAPRFVHNFLAGTSSIQQALAAYVQAVKQGQYPTPSHGY